MEKMSPARQICITAVCIALCCVLPMAFHSVGLGSTFCPMHIPVLLCGLVCGPVYGVLCGIVGPLLSSVTTGMPSATVLISMLPELITYGLVSGFAMGHIRVGKRGVDLYLSLGSAMVLGRVVGGIAKALFYLGTGQAFSLALWVSGYFVTTLPGILCHLILIPVLVESLVKTKLIPNRYKKEVPYGEKRCNCVL